MVVIGHVEQGCATEITRVRLSAAFGKPRGKNQEQAHDGRLYCSKHNSSRTKHKKKKKQKKISGFEPIAPQHNFCAIATKLKKKQTRHCGNAFVPSGPPEFLQSG